MTEQDVPVLAGVLSVLTLISSWAGDDDTVYAFLNRKPTSSEAIARIRFVLLKFFASLYARRIYRTLSC